MLPGIGEFGIPQFYQTRLPEKCNLPLPVNRLFKMTATFTIDGPPRTKKTHNQVVMIHGFPRVLPSKQHAKWFKNAMSQSPVIRTLLRDRGIPLPLAGPVRIAAVFYRDADSGDLAGYEQALGDWLQSSRLRPKRTGAGILEDDKQIKSWDGTHLEVDRARPRIEVTVYVLGAEQSSLFTGTRE